MATYTPNYNLKKPSTSDTIKIADLNGNMDIVDSTMGTFSSDITDLKSAIVDINEALAAAGLVIYNSQFYINPDGNSLPT